MTRQVIVFEDHTHNNFRPLAASIPTYEIRRGMFNLRERVELLLSPENVTVKQCGLLSRSILAPLHTCKNWQINPSKLTDKSGDSASVLWLNGRSLPSFQILQALLSADGPESNFVFFDEFGLVAASLSAEESEKLLKSWQAWNSVWSTEDTTWNCDFLKSLAMPGQNSIKALGHIWDIVPATSELLNDDICYLADGKTFSRNPFGIFPAPDNNHPFWLEDTCLKPGAGAFASPNSEHQLWVGKNINLAPGTAIDTSKGPVILDNNVTVMPHCFLEGPLYVGAGCIVKTGAAIYGESSFGIGNRIAGEIGESTFSDFANKQHDGFIGHAVLGSWTNLGAMTTCSDLKNNYGNVRMDLGSGAVDTGLRFVGLMLGDHVKTAIGTLFNTGTCVGFASNIFGGVMPPKFVKRFSWGGMPENPEYDVEKAMQTAEVVMSRRGCRLTDEAKKLFLFLA